jgi:Arc/MetJ family transcription regulator
MRTNIEIDDKLMEAAMKALKAKTKKETVEHGLNLILQHTSREDLRKLRGKVDMYADAEKRAVQIISEADLPKYRKKRS